MRKLLMQRYNIHIFSLVRFVGLCLRFAEDFETSLDDWKPDMTDSNIMNLCVVSEGTYEVCSRTVAQKQDKSGTMSYFSSKYTMFLETCASPRLENH